MIPDLKKGGLVIDGDFCLPLDLEPTSVYFQVYYFHDFEHVLTRDILQLRSGHITHVVLTKHLRSDCEIKWKFCDLDTNVELQGCLFKGTIENYDDARSKLPWYHQ